MQEGLFRFRQQRIHHLGQEAIEKMEEVVKMSGGIVGRFELEHGFRALVTARHDGIHPELQFLLGVRVVLDDVLRHPALDAAAAPFGLGGLVTRFQ